MNTHSTHRLAGQGKFARITTTDIDAALKDMAAADGYDGTKLYHTDRLLRFDTAPAESEQPEEPAIILIGLKPAPTDWPMVAFRVVYAALMAATVAGGVVVCAYLF